MNRREAFELLSKVFAVSAIAIVLILLAGLAFGVVHVVKIFF